jgi:hypothetical protein
MAIEFVPKKYVVPAIVGLVILISLILAGCPFYNVWSAKMAGEAELAQANQNRQIMSLKAGRRLKQRTTRPKPRLPGRREWRRLIRLLGTA